MKALRLIRILREETLDDLALAINTRRATASTVERYPQRASKPIRAKLVAHYKAPFDGLSRDVDNLAMAEGLLDACRGNATPKRKKA